MTARTYWKCLLGLLVCASVAGNIGHILLSQTPHPVPAALYAAVPPLVLAATVEGLALTVGAEVRRWVYRAGVAGAAVIAGGAFAASYIALRDLAVALGISPAVAPVMPVLIDAAMAVATAMVLALRPTPVQADAAVAPVEVHAQPAPVSAPEQVPVSGAAWSTDRGAGPVTGHDAVAQAGTPPVHGDAQLHLVTGVGDAGGDSDGTGRAADAPAVSVLPEHVRQAAELVEQGTTALEVERVAQVLAMAAAGASARAIAEAVPANRRTVGKVLSAVGGEEAG